MKRIIALVFICAAFVLNAGAQQKKTAAEILKEACVKAGKENKKVFVMFTASWCGWCHRMENSMNDEDCKKYFDENFVILHMVVDESADKKNLETPSASEMRNQYGGDGQGIPFWLVFDKDGNLVGDSMKSEEGTSTKSNVGCPAEEDEINYFLDILKKTTKVSEEQVEKITKRFRKNKG